MKTEWDYTHLAKAYLTRPDYSDVALNKMFEIAGSEATDLACDVGAGVAHLTLKLAAKELVVDAVEPNDAMRALGKKRTEALSNVSWFEGTGENTGMSAEKYDIVTFGSSFNVTDRQKALLETKRILKPQGWFVAMWNHRDLSDPIQQEIESIIKKHVAEYGYGTRREDQSAEIDRSGLFEKVHYVEGDVEHQQSIEEVVEAWRSHATLHRQAGEKFDLIIDEIESFLKGLNTEAIKIPYTTRLWMAKLK